MHVIKARNVAEALPEGVHYLLCSGREETSRAGNALVAPGPVTTVYERPRERVMFSAVRDANPFFHLVEGLWMLAGRGDAALLDHFVRDFGERFAEADGNIHGAYGARWRRHFENETYTGEGPAPYYIDQLAECIQELMTNPGSRQVVLTMWDPEADLGVKGLKDRPCNTQVYFRVRGFRADLWPDGLEITGESRVLDMTVLCRSNDIILGAYGANAVHMSMMQEYVAAMVGVEVGTYYQVSNNFHMYTSELSRLKARNGHSTMLTRDLGDNRYVRDLGIRPSLMVTHPASFDEEVRLVLKTYEGLIASTPEFVTLQPPNLHNGFLSGTVWPMLMAHRVRRDKTQAQMWARNVDATDWRVAAQEWIARRKPS